MERILVICGDAWHPAETIRRGVEALGVDDFEFTFVEDGVSGLRESLADFRVIMLAKANMVSAADPRPWMTPESSVALQEHLQRGNGLVAVHAGTSRYDPLPGMKELVGGAFARHSEPCAVTLEPHHDHPLADGVVNFTVQDEHYFIAMSNDPVAVVLHSRSEHGLQPAGWTRLPAAGGRIYVLTPGHYLEVWLHPAFQKLLLNGLRWAARLN